jgi:hypothetical protein
MVLKRRSTMTSQMVRVNNAGISPLTKTPPMNRRKTMSAKTSNVLPAKTHDLLSVLEHGRATDGISVGHIVEAMPVYVDENDISHPEYYLGEVVAIRQVDSDPPGTTRPFFYIHFLTEGPKLDDWLPLSHLRQIGSLSLLEQRIRSLGDPGDPKNFFTLSSFSATSSAIHPRFQVKSIRGIQLGNLAVLKAWYPSPYPEMISCPDKYIKICDTCLSYFRSADELSRHWRYCLFNHPPGNEIYRHEDHSVFEIDGEVHFGYCERLLLLAKLFLREKRACGQDASQYAQVRTFHFYVLCKWRQDGDGRAELVGYFSKLKNNARDSNILSCILVLPHMQRRGYGNFLIDLSYELGRIEGRVGSAERPLSELGQLTFYPYWMKRIMPILKRMLSARTDIVLAELAQETGIITEDIVETLKHFGILKEWSAAGVVVVVTPEVLEAFQAHDRPTNTSYVRFSPPQLQWTPLYNFNNSTP